MSYYYDDPCEDDKKEDRDANLGIFELALRNAHRDEQLRPGGLWCTGRASRDVWVDGLECFASLSVGIDYRRLGYVHVEIRYEDDTGCARTDSVDGWPSEFDCQMLWDMAVENLAEQTEAFRKDRDFVPIQPMPVSNG